MKSDRQRLTVLFSNEQRETIAKAIEKVNRGRVQWAYAQGQGESAFIRDAAVYTAKRILESNSREKLLSKHAEEVAQLVFSLESECGRLRRALLTLKPDLPKLKRAKR